MAEFNKKISELPDFVFTEESLFIAANPVEGGYSTGYIRAYDLADSILSIFEYPLKLLTTSKTVVGAIKEIAESIGTVILIGILEAGETTLALEHNFVTLDKHFEVYSNPYPNHISVSIGRVELTFDEQLENVTVKVVIF